MGLILIAPNLLLRIVTCCLGSLYRRTKAWICNRKGSSLEPYVTYAMEELRDPQSQRVKLLIEAERAHLFARLYYHYMCLMEVCRSVGLVE
jgi:hypothetical protein